MEPFSAASKACAAWISQAKVTLAEDHAGLKNRERKNVRVDAFCSRFGS